MKATWLMNRSTLDLISNPPPELKTRWEKEAREREEERNRLVSLVVNASYIKPLERLLESLGPWSFDFWVAFEFKGGNKATASDVMNSFIMAYYNRVVEYLKDHGHENVGEEVVKQDITTTINVKYGDLSGLRRDIMRLRSSEEGHGHVEMWTSDSHWPIEFLLQKLCNEARDGISNTLEYEYWCSDRGSSNG